MLEESEYIEVQGARVHNLQNIDVKIPRNQLVVITGLSGSGKSSLAFDTIYAEGQRRYVETFSSYARQFMGNIERPDVDKIDGLSPVISIEQKTISRNPRSTVGTITEIYDFLRLLYARCATAFSHQTGEQMVRYSDGQIIDLINQSFQDKDVVILYPVVRGRKGHYKELFRQILRQGFLKARVNGEIRDLADNISLDRYSRHDIEVVVDRLKVNTASEKRLLKSLEVALKMGRGVMMLLESETQQVRFFSRKLMCPTTGIAYDSPEPNTFSFNSPYGACSDCNGLGEVSEVDRKKLIPDEEVSIKKGGLAPLGEYKNNWIFRQIEAILIKYDTKITTPIKEIPKEVMSKILFGTDERLKIDSGVGVSEYSVNYEGLINFIGRQSEENPTPALKRWAESFMNKIPCHQCNGTRLKKDSQYFKIKEKNIAEVAHLDIDNLVHWLSDVEDHFTKQQKRIGRDVLKEIRSRSQFLLDVGLSYLTLNRSAKTISGGEAQRIRLATQIGSKLVGVLYILDEPSIGLHQRDNKKLINSLKQLRDNDNSVIVVEHDKEMMLSADYVIDIGPRAGVHGGKVTAAGTPEEFRKLNTLTTDYISGARTIPIPEIRRKGNGNFLTLKGASGNNLKNVTLKLELGKFTCITGVSGSGKSSLVNQTLYPILHNHFYKTNRPHLPYKSIKGIEHIDKVIDIDQAPIGRTPRSNPATYTGVFSEIRTLFSRIPESKIRGYKPGRFSFNTKGGRCETCTGAGLKTIEMNFLPDVFVQCETCNGKRYNRETLEVRFKGKSISDVLEMTVADGVVFFSEIPKIYAKLVTLLDVGLGYLKIGQPSTTLSGGEAQRVKLATELSKKATGKTLYILDEPSTGLHFEDIRILLEVLNRLVDQGNSVIVIEHNLDLVKVADYIIDVGPDGGIGGGEIIAEGTPEQIIKLDKGYTAEFLKEELDQK